MATSQATRALLLLACSLVRIDVFVAPLRPAPTIQLYAEDGPSRRGRRRARKERTHLTTPTEAPAPKKAIPRPSVLDGIGKIRAHAGGAFAETPIFTMVDSATIGDDMCRDPPAGTPRVIPAPLVAQLKPEYVDPIVARSVGEA